MATTYKTERVEFKGMSQEVINGLLKVQYTALKEAGNHLRKQLHAHVKAMPRTDIRRKQNWGNIAVRTYTRTKYGFVVAQVGVKDAGHAKGEAAATARYDSSVGVGSNHYLTNVTQANIGEMRNIMAQYLPGIENTNSMGEQEDILDGE